MKKIILTRGECERLNILLAWWAAARGEDFTLCHNIIAILRSISADKTCSGAQLRKNITVKRK